jgi:hypothetical protein
MPHPPDCDQIAGWLVLLAVSLVGSGIAVYRSAAQIIGTFAGSGHANWVATVRQAPREAISYATAALFEILSTGLWVMLIPAFFGRRRHARPLLWIFLSAALLTRLASIKHGRPWMFVGLIPLLAWLTYTVRSRRVRFTFVRPGPVTAWPLAAGVVIAGVALMAWGTFH